MLSKCKIALVDGSAPNPENRLWRDCPRVNRGAFSFVLRGLSVIKQYNSLPEILKTPHSGSFLPGNFYLRLYL